MFRFARYALLLGAALLLAQPALCANLVNGGSFDSSADLSFWQNVDSSKTVSAAHDHTGGSSSALRTENTSGGSGIYIHQCIPVTANQSYSLEAYILQPLDEQIAEGRADIDLHWYGVADCTQSLGLASVSSSGSTNDQWELLTLQAVAPNGASAASLLLENWNIVAQSTDAHVIYFDDVYLPEPHSSALILAALFILWALHKMNPHGICNRSR